jgi:ribosomal protein S18 acetylase RimI-like enzyme
MRYRLYMPEDFEALYAIERLCFQPPLRFSRGYLEKVTQARNGATWVAESDAGTLAGFAVLEWKREHDGGVVAYVVTIEVLHEHRRQGVGSELLRRMEESAQASGAWCIWLHVDERNEAARKLYCKHGYDKAGAAKNFYGPGRVAEILFKELARDSTLRGSSERGDEAKGA